MLELGFKSCYLKRGFWTRREKERIEQVTMLNYYYYYCYSFFLYNGKNWKEYEKNGKLLEKIFSE